MNWLKKLSQVEIRSIHDEMGDMDDDLYYQAWELGRASSIGILSDKDVYLVATVGKKVVGVLFTSLNGDRYSFDVVVDPEYQRQGIGRQLVGEGVQEFRNLDIPDIKMQLDVVNPAMQKVLMEHGLQVQDQIGPDRVIMGSTHLMTKIANSLPHVVIDHAGSYFETGTPVEFRYFRNTVPAPNMGEKFQQHIEPAGRYLNQNENQDRLDYLENVENVEFGNIQFDNPLVIQSNLGDGIYDSLSWKYILAKKFGKTGRELSLALIEAGYDGIVTVAMHNGKPAYTSEIVDLRPLIQSIE